VFIGGSYLMVGHDTILVDRLIRNEIHLFVHRKRISFYYFLPVSIFNLWGNVLSIDNTNTVFVVYNQNSFRN